MGRISKQINSLLLERATVFLPFLFLLYRNHIITIIAIYFILKQHFASQAQMWQLIVLGTSIYTKKRGLLTIHSLTSFRSRNYPHLMNEQSQTHAEYEQSSRTMPKRLQLSINISRMASHDACCRR